MVAHYYNTLAAIPYYVPDVVSAFSSKFVRVNDVTGLVLRHVSVVRSQGRTKEDKKKKRTRVAREVYYFGPCPKTKHGA